MAPFYTIIISLLLYPVLGWIVVFFTKDKRPLLRKLLIVSGGMSFAIVLASVMGVITISSGVNWLLLTIPYLFLCLLLWTGKRWGSQLFKRLSNLLMIIVFGIGYLLSTIGSLFTLFAVSDLDTDQRLSLSKNLIYFERNIGQGPDPSVRMKEIEIYKKISWLPVFATKVHRVVYDEWNTPLQPQLIVSYSNEKNLLFLRSQVSGYRTWNFSDTIQVNTTSANSVFAKKRL
jgi:hypothetical protein